MRLAQRSPAQLRLPQVRLGPRLLARVPLWHPAWALPRVPDQLSPPSPAPSAPALLRLRLAVRLSSLRRAPARVPALGPERVRRLQAVRPRQALPRTRIG